MRAALNGDTAVAGWTKRLPLLLRLTLIAGTVCIVGLTGNYVGLARMYSPVSPVTMTFYEKLAGAYSVQDVAACPAHWLNDEVEPGGAMCPNGVTLVSHFHLWELCRQQENWVGVEWGAGTTAGLILTNRFARFVSVEHDQAVADAFRALHAANVTARFPGWELRHVPLGQGSASHPEGWDYANVELAEPGSYTWVVVGPNARGLVLPRALDVMAPSGAVLVITSTSKDEATVLEASLPKQWPRAYTGSDDAGTLVAMSCDRGGCPEMA